MAFVHPTAMLAETVDCLNCRPGKIYVDATLGGAGHAGLICSRIRPGGRLIGIDQDPAAVANAKEVLSSQEVTCHLFHDNYVNMPSLLDSLGIARVDGVVLDLGLSLYQLRQSGRGFSFSGEEPLDMRMDPRLPVTAADLVDQMPAGELERIFKAYGEERWARRIAERIVSERAHRPLRTSKALAALVTDAVPSRSAVRQRIHPATRVFMALRIAVNRELEVLRTFLSFVLNYLAPGGRLCVLSFHSLEDRLVKRAMRQWEKGCTCPPGLPVCGCGKKPLVRRITAKPLRPGSEELAVNPMARSTRLRAVEKL